MFKNIDNKMEAFIRKIRTGEPSDKEQEVLCG